MPIVCKDPSRGLVSDQDTHCLQACKPAAHLPRTPLQLLSRLTTPTDQTTTPTTYTYTCTYTFSYAYTYSSYSQHSSCYETLHLRIHNTPCTPAIQPPPLPVLPPLNAARCLYGPPQLDAGSVGTLETSDPGPNGRPVVQPPAPIATPSPSPSPA